MAKKKDESIIDPPEEKKRCGAPKGNRFWLQRSSHGRKPIFASPEQLWEACCEYFQWVEDNPLWESKVASNKGEPEIMILPKMQAMTISALCLFLDIDRTTWQGYTTKEDFIHITTRAEDVIYHQKFSGASADLLNANIIARDLGLRDKQDVEIHGELKGLTNEQIDLRLSQLLGKVGTPDVTGGAEEA